MSRVKQKPIGTKMKENKGRKITMKTQNKLPHMQHSVCGSITVLAVGMFLLVGQSNAPAQWDNWDDGDALSPPVTWTELDPLYSAGSSTVPNTYDASSGKYHLVVDPSSGQQNFPANFPGRSLSLPTASSYSNYTDFYVSVDVAGFSVATAQGFGLLARASELGWHTTDAYFLGIASGGTISSDNYVQIYGVQNEGLINLVGSGHNGRGHMDIAPLDPAKTYRMVFMGRGTDLEGRLFELPNLTTPIVDVYVNTAASTIVTNADGAAIASGACGLIVLDLSPLSGQFLGADVTFDNYYASKRVPLKITDMVVKDNFNDGNDTGWYRYDPIYLASQANHLGLPPQNTWTLTNGVYNLHAEPTPMLDPLGPARVGSIDTTATLGDFRVAVDLMSFNPDLDMAFGFLARVQTPGPGMTDAHAMTFQNRPNWHDFDLIRIVDESPAVNFDLDAQDSIKGIDMSTNTFRFVFTGKGNVLRGLIFKLPETMNPLVDCVAVDTNLPAYTSGNVALFGFDNSNPHDLAVDVTFDNYSDTAIAAPAVSLTVGSVPITGETGGQVTITWPANNEGIWVLESSPTLGPGAVWTKLTTGRLMYDAVTGKYTYTGAAAMATTGDTFYRLKQV
jgi:hypothetical protein